MTEPQPIKPQWFHILLSVSDGPLHGTAIMEEVLDRTDGQVRLWPGMLYGCLKEMAERGVIAEVEPPPEAPTHRGKRRFYGITKVGLSTLRTEVVRLERYLNVARQKSVGRDPNPA